MNQEIERRRTFAIIAHPDAGKTSLTEKLLLTLAFRRSDSGGRCGKIKQNQENSDIRLDGHRKAAWYFRYHIRDGVRL